MMLLPLPGPKKGVRTLEGRLIDPDACTTGGGMLRLRGGVAQGDASGDVGMPRGVSAGARVQAPA